MTTAQNTPQNLYQPPVTSSKVLARLDGVSVGTGANYTIYQAPDRMRAIINWFSFDNRSSGGTGRMVAFFITAPTGNSPRIDYRYVAEDSVERIIDLGSELVLGPGDKLEAIAAGNAVTADIYVCGRIDNSPS